MVRRPLGFAGSPTAGAVGLLRAARDMQEMHLQVRAPARRRCHWENMMEPWQRWGLLHSQETYDEEAVQVSERRVDSL